MALAPLPPIAAPTPRAFGALPPAQRILTAYQPVLDKLGATAYSIVDDGLGLKASFDAATGAQVSMAKTLLRSEVEGVRLIVDYPGNKPIARGIPSAQSVVSALKEVVPGVQRVEIVGLPMPGGPEHVSVVVDTAQRAAAMAQLFRDSLPTGTTIGFTYIPS